MHTKERVHHNTMIKILLNAIKILNSGKKDDDIHIMKTIHYLCGCEERLYPPTIREASLTCKKHGDSIEKIVTVEFFSEEK